MELTKSCSANSLYSRTRQWDVGLQPACPRRGLPGPWGVGRAWEPRQPCPWATRCPTPASLVDPTLGQACHVACEPGFLPTEVPGERGPRTTQCHWGFTEITPYHLLHAAAKHGLNLSPACVTLRLQRDKREGGNQQGWGPRQASGAVRAQEAGSAP